ncbi:MAG: hypothetical protein A3H50_00565 [Candidatus Levybacteria bacterium RIFCSPLOWO2_02_FULL_37_10]|nr:MAG: hypothetical protein A2860_02200 [Candidatus Levybacteria bacterium RIFCSPHIGHO2_01_FULL_37_33]OGH29724.1 MAG: hypothetical protein A3F30_00375 [Candidatus Levybacteria bacterium RIFCSPHIGHO2_12_FULL_37_12]OGH44176.1 MAG: hypothetical protein A3H50_00565 [Candidatus Levybacteria bacterium RIFCSPLOWO2_02_FULL_37_10]
MIKTAQKKKATTQKFIEIENIDEDIVILSGKNASLIIEVNATNFSLLSKEEQDSKIFSYASLLNSLSFPIQIFIRSKKLDVSSYLKLLETQAAQTENQLLSSQIRLYRDFVKELVKVNTVLDKKFYIVISYSYLEKGVMASSDSFLGLAKTSLHSKAESVLSQLARLNLRAKPLGKEELIKLFYEIYNGDTVETNQITDEIKTPIVKGGNSA